MDLIKGISLNTYSGCSKDKLLINNGTEEAVNFDVYHEKDYCELAFKPRNCWRSLSTEEKGILLSNEDSLHYNTTISLKKLPLPIINQFQELDLQNCKDRTDVLKRLRAKKELLNRLNDDINELLSSFALREQFNYHSLVVTKPNLETLSYYLRGNEFKYLGLHVDRSTTFDIDTAESSKNRICINLSEENRTFLFVNLTLKQIYNMLEQTKMLNMGLVNVGNISEYFFQFFPSYPVIRITQEPYEFYIAPTDNCLHDGSTLNRNKIDITLTYLGYFDHFCKPIKHASM